MISFLATCNRRLGHLVSWLTFFMVVVMAVNVLSRYMFKTTIVWQQELVIFFHAIIFLSAAGYTMQEDKHVRVDVLYQNFSEKNKALVNMLGIILLLLPSCFVIGWNSYDFIVQSWSIQEASSEYNGMPGIFLLKTCIWVFCLSLILESIHQLLKSIHVLRG